MKWYFALLPLALVGGLLLNWQLSQPSHTRAWRADHSRLPEVTEAGGIYRVANIRNWDYATDGSVTRQEWIAAEIDPDRLVGTGFLVEPFGGHDAIAHTMLSFSFSDGASYIASIEARREVGEEYSAVKAAVLPIFEYLFVWTTERDMYLNSEFMSGDQLYLYPLDIPLDQQRAVLKAMLAETAEIQAQPRWYNTLFSNCTNVLARTVNKFAPDAVPFDKAWVLTGYAAEFLYEQGFFGTALTFHEARARAHISPLIREFHGIADPVAFSQAIRARRSGG
ncbi:lipoprotein N-acyltransferase Lnb domain-containing protein [Maliponia aquimaris]|uniref:Lnb N-terminal periplasmic domain-containing protein n=1 Tax=Maliponia aquimaris TaxID=1673631 RepID=A0A238KVB9_9RHOB|nr:DUF4105 domain-containing protein [Maliponia aquimaris]SMX46647.1 hypothetical protein MAA8898_03468 [Maliponia aquimaris]